jgi:acetyltransferase-like isoleucine patch superfamily enzyme
MKEGILSGARNRLLQMLARNAPGATTWRVWLNRWRGVNIGEKVWIGYDAIIETSRPDLVTIKDGGTVGMRAIIIAHFHEQQGVTIEEGGTVGPGAIVLPGVTIGRDAIVTAGSVVTASVAARTMVQGNPARPVAKIGVPMTPSMTLKEFSKHLKPIRSR